MNKDGMPTGALPPFEPWMQGKTAATICFVDSARRFLENSQETHATRQLEYFVVNLKARLNELTDWLSVEEFINSINKQAKEGWSLGDTQISLIPDKENK